MHESDTNEQNNWLDTALSVDMLQEDYLAHLADLQHQLHQKEAQIQKIKDNHQLEMAHLKQQLQHQLQVALLKHYQHHQTQFLTTMTSLEQMRLMYAALHKKMQKLMHP